MSVAAPGSGPNGALAHPFRTYDPRLEPIAAKVLAEERLERRRRAGALCISRRAGRRLAGQSRARADARRRHLLQRQSPHQSHQRLRGGLQAVRLRPQEGRPGRLHHGARRGVGDRGVRLLRGRHRVSHRRRPASRPAASNISSTSSAASRSASPRCTSRPSPWWRSRFWRGAPSSPSTRRLLKLREAGVDSMPGGGAEIFAARVRSIICDHKIDGDEWLETARTGAQAGLQVERDHALRPHRERRRPRRPPAQAARAAGRDRRLPDLHPAGVSPGEHAARSPAGDHRPDRHSADRRQPPDARQLSRTSRPTGR